MANQEHIDILRRGVDVWNQWRRTNLNTKPDFTHADLQGIKLIGADLREVYFLGANLNNSVLCESLLSGANLRGAVITKSDLRNSRLNEASINHAWLTYSNLQGANLGGAYIVNSDLRNANLSRAILNNANLRKSNLYYANLSGANISEANLSHADLYGANLKDAILYSTILGDTNLAEAKGLETCIHYGPSIVDIRTMAKSGMLPLHFLRGSGVPDVIIDYVPSLLSDPIQFYSCFVSYSNRDRAFAERLYADLQNQGVRCWFAPEDLKIGDRIRNTIDESIRVYDKLLIVLSKDSIESDWVEQEVESALLREREQGKTVLFPIRLDETVMGIKSGWPALIRNTRNIGDFTQWEVCNEYEKAFKRLIKDLNQQKSKK